MVSTKNVCQFGPAVWVEIYIYIWALLYRLASMGIKLCQGVFLKKLTRPLNLEIINLAQNNPVVLPSSPIKIWGKCSRGSGVMIGQTNGLTKKTNRDYYFTKFYIFLLNPFYCFNVHASSYVFPFFSCKWVVDLIFVCRFTTVPFKPPSDLVCKLYNIQQILLLINQFSVRKIRFSLSSIIKQRIKGLKD